MIQFSHLILVSVLLAMEARTKGRIILFFFYVPEHELTIPEIKILIDALQAASFVTEKKTTELVEKVAALGGSHKAELLKENMICFNTRKHTNEAILYTVDGMSPSNTISSALFLMLFMCRAHAGVCHFSHTSQANSLRWLCCVAYFHYLIPAYFLPVKPCLGLDF